MMMLTPTMKMTKNIKNLKFNNHSHSLIMPSFQEQFKDEKFYIALFLVKKKEWNVSAMIYNLHGTRPKYNRYVEVSLFLLIKHCIGESRGPGYSYIYRKQTQETLKVKTTMEKENIRPEKELRVYYLLQ